MIIDIQTTPQTSAVAESISSLSGNVQKIESESFYILVNAKHVFHDAHNKTIVCLTNDRQNIQPKLLEDIAEYYHTNGEDFPNHIKNSFAVVVIDYAKKRVTAAIDKVGRSQLYYCKNKNGISFSTKPSILHETGIIKKTLCKQAVYNYVFFHMVPAPLSIFEGINKLSASEILGWQQGSLHNNFYWTPNFSKNQSNTSIDDYSEQLHQLLNEIVGEAVEDEKTTGSFLSGGLDSSTISGKFADIYPDHAKTFSIGFNAEGYDEIEFARTASKHFSTQANEHYVTPADVKSFITGVVSSYEEPFGNSSAIPTYFCAKLAADHGVTTLLAGDGGDEIFAGNERYVKQGVFQQYQKIPKLLRKYIVEPIFAHEYPIFPLNKIASYIRQANIAMPGRLQSYNLVEQIGSSTIFSNAFLNTVDPQYPHKLQNDIYQRPKNASYIDRMLYLDWQNTLADNDLRKVTTMCETAGISVQYPLLDDRLIDFSLQLPDQLKLKKNNLRYFFKYAMKDYLPQKILNKQKHGFGLPFGVWLSENPELQKIAQDALTKLEARDILHPDFIHTLMSLHNNKHASYYGEMVWILMILALWLEHHGL